MRQIKNKIFCCLFLFLFCFCFCLFSVFVTHDEIPETPDGFHHQYHERIIVLFVRYYIKHIDKHSPYKNKALTSNKFLNADSWNAV